MKIENKLSRREFIRLAGLATVGTVAAACAPALKPTAAAVGAAAAVAATKAPAIAAPTVLTPKTVKVGILAVNAKEFQEIIAKTGFTKQTGINVEIVNRTDTKETELARLASAFQAGTSPYDLIDFEDELTTSFSRAGYMIGLDDVIPAEVWADFSPAMMDYTKVWSAYNNQTFRIIHNWEMPYWWYRKDWFDAKNVALPKTWEDVAALGKVFTDTGKNVWATEDGLLKGAFLNVYLAWVTLQAGGNPFDVGDTYKTALQYIYDLMYTNNTLNPASLQKDYNQQNADYIADKVAFMRQWPFVYDVVRGDANKAWFTTEDKLAFALPPVGPGGKGGSTYTAAWGFGIVKTAPNQSEAKELLKFLYSNDVAPVAATTSYWFVNARKSVLAALPDTGIAHQMKTYTDAGVIGVRPFHPRFVEALTILEDTASAYLTKQISIDDSMKQAKDQLAALS
ncbi:MAG: extracellular solute-binding protein [Anaerolineaceae bacterium]|nr:extracellular solute-binding protein [Anaerolineaceae bacterium]